MKRFSFTAKEIDEHTSGAGVWHDFVRRREAEIAFSVLGESRFGLALELGAGDGTQSVTIAKWCDRLICTELDEQSYAWKGKSILERQLPNVDYRLCDAQDLSPFEDQSFDLICSSNVLEHIPDVDRCLRECRRVLKDGGVMWHSMPTRWWKIFNYSLARLYGGSRGVHGVSASHREEFRIFGRAAWRHRFQSNGFALQQIVGMPFYVGHGNKFIPLIKAGNLARLPATYLYIARKGAVIS